MKIEYISHQGSDLTVVNAARTSFNKESSELSSKDTSLIKFLARNNHWTPFAHTSITLRETVPIFIARQRFKHQIGFVYNEVSRRYVDTPPEFYRPTVWRKRSEKLKQGSTDEEIPVNPVFLNQFYTEVEAAYQKLLSISVCPEQARMLLPQSMYTTYYVTGNVASFARAYNLRKPGTHAQKEIQEVASEWDKIIRPLFPNSWEELTNENKN